MCESNEREWHTIDKCVHHMSGNDTIEIYVQHMRSTGIIMSGIEKCVHQMRENGIPSINVCIIEEGMRYH